jgi:hypothetical protein
MLTLALLTPGRFERGWGRGLPEPYAEATAALRIAAKCDSPRVRAAALGEQPK